MLKIEYLEEGEGEVGVNGFGAGGGLEAGWWRVVGKDAGVE